MLGRIAFENGKELAESRGGQDPKEGRIFSCCERIFPKMGRSWNISEELSPERREQNKKGLPFRANLLVYRRGRQRFRM